MSEKTTENELKPLTAKVPESFHWQVRRWCAEHRISAQDLIVKGITKLTGIKL